MPHYKDPQNKVHFIESNAFEHMLPAGSVQITDAEAAELQAQAVPPLVEAAPIDPVDKLKGFLSANPDVAEILK